ncbi:L-threonylcarbamoyladenylate synthase [Acidobacteriota bacterium]
MVKKTRIVPVDTSKIESPKIQEISQVLMENGVIVCPTDTFYGLGASCFSIPAVKEIYALKGRDADKPLSVVVSDRDMLDRVAFPPSNKFDSLLARLWPGPLTVILEASADLPQELLGRRRTIGVRLPDFSWLRHLIRSTGFPLTATSANLTGLPEISDSAEAIDVFDGKVDLIVDSGRTTGGSASTVIDLTAENPVILREGAVPTEIIHKLLE